MLLLSLYRCTVIWQTLWACSAGLLLDTIGMSRDAFGGLVQTHLTLNMTSCIHHVAFVCPAVKLLNKISHLRVAYVYSSGTILRPSVGIVLASASCVAQGPSSYEIHYSIFVWPSDVNFGTKEVMFSVVLVCLLPVCWWGTFFKKLWTDCNEILWRIRDGKRKKNLLRWVNEQITP